MNKKIIMLMALAAISSISIALSFQTFDNYSDFISGRISFSQNIDDKEAEGLKYMREEEKLARDVYNKMYEKYDIRPFRNIPKAEQTHMDFVKDLLVKYNIDDPVTNDAAGEFTNKDLKELYNKLIEQGNLSLIDALKAGALIEETDINDLNAYIEKTTSADIKQTYYYLKSGSENHLRAFVRNLRSNGIEYIPVVLSKDEYDKIIVSADSNRKYLGNGNCINRNYNYCDSTGKRSGYGKGKGNGRGNWNCNNRGNGYGNGDGDGYGRGNRNWNNDTENKSWYCPRLNIYRNK